MMPADAKTRNEIAFFESNVSFQNVMDFWVEPKSGGGTTIGFGIGPLATTKLWTADFTPGVWHQLAIHVLWSVNAQTGSIDVWFDGTQVITARNAKTKADGNTLFFQTGLHRAAVANFTDVIYFDDFIEADNLADAKIGAPTMGDGGVGTDASGGGGAAGSGGSGGAAGATDAGNSTGPGGSTGAGGATGTGGASGATVGSGGAVTTGTGNAGTSGSTGASTGGTGGGRPSGADAPAGCSCTLVDRGEPAAGWLALGLVLGASIVRRGRRRSQ